MVERLGCRERKRREAKRRRYTRKTHSAMNSNGTIHALRQHTNTNSFAFVWLAATRRTHTHTLPYIRTYMKPIHGPYKITIDLCISVI